MKPNETRTRSLVKSISWRVIATLITVFVIYMFIYDVMLSVGITVVGMALSFIAYYVHERIWNKIRWQLE